MQCFTPAHPAEPWTRDRSTHCGDPIISGSREVDRLGPSRINGNKQIGQEKKRRKGPPYFAEVRMYVGMSSVGRAAGYWELESSVLTLSI